jgi:hypothetical protein
VYIDRLRNIAITLYKDGQSSGGHLNPVRAKFPYAGHNGVCGRGGVVSPCIKLDTRKR